MKNKTNFYFTRHGETDSNAIRPRVLAGQGDDSPLNDKGKEMAQWARDTLKEKEIDTVYTSPLKRAVETAEIIAEPYGIEVNIHQGLIENNCGRWEHKAWDWIMENDRKAYDKWMQRPDIFPYPEGENFTESVTRFSDAVVEIADNHPGETILCVAHNTVLKTFLACCLGMPLYMAREIPHENCGLSFVEYTEEGHFKVRMINASWKFL